MKVIVAADERWGIGWDGRLMVRIPEDLRRFKALTMGGTVVMGRRTLKTLPEGKPLKGRGNIILSAETGFNVPGAMIAHSLEEALAYIAALDERDVFVIGGQSIYEQFLPYCARAYVTRWSRGRDEEADAFFPDLDVSDVWALSEQSDEKRHEDITYRYRTYDNADVRPLPIVGRILRA